MGPDGIVEIEHKSRCRVRSGKFDQDLLLPSESFKMELNLKGVFKKCKNDKLSLFFSKNKALIRCSNHFSENETPMHKLEMNPCSCRSRCSQGARNALLASFPHSHGAGGPSVRPDRWGLQ